MSLKNIFHKLGDDFAIMAGKLPHDWVNATTDLLAGLEKAKNLLNSPTAITVAAMFPKGLGTIALADLQNIIANALPALEIAQGCEKAVSGITDPAKKADAVLGYLLANMGKMPQEWQDKHWLNIAETILSKLLNISINDAKLLLLSKTDAL